MKARFVGRMAAVMMLVTSIQLTAQEKLEQHDGATQYRVKVLNTLGGTASAGNAINNRSMVMGTGNLTSDGTAHASVWLRNSVYDVGTLGGPNSAIAWSQKNDRGQIAGISETADL